jgi:chromosomal replication initiation ATPase DnaA
LRYRRFVEEGLLREIGNPFEAVRWQAVLGDESFVQKLRDHLRGLHKQRREVTSVRRAMASIDPEGILQRVCEKYKVDRERLVSRRQRGLYARNVAMWMIWESGTKSLREIGELFGGLDYAAVAQRIRRTRSSHDATAAKKLMAIILNV